MLSILSYISITILSQCCKKSMDITNNELLINTRLNFHLKIVLKIMS